MFQQWFYHIFQVTFTVLNIITLTIMNNKTFKRSFFDQDISLQIYDTPLSINSFKLQQSQKQQNFQKTSFQNTLFNKNQNIDKYLMLQSKLNCDNSQNQYQQSFDQQKDQQVLSKDQIKKRNKQSAKNCRKKKKQYIQKLEQQSIANEKKVKALTLKVRELQKELNQIKYSNTLEKQTFTQINRVCLQKLEHVLNDSQKHQVDSFIMEIKERIGPAGRDRANLLNYHMSEYMDNMLADFQKYFVNCALKKKGLWGKQQNQFDIKIRQILDLSQQKKILLIRKYREKIHIQAVVYHDICQKIYTNYVALANQAKILEQTMLKVKDDLEIKNMGRIVLWFQQNKHHPLVRRSKQQWIQSFSKDDNLELNNKIRKRYKLDNDQINFV